MTINYSFYKMKKKYSKLLLSIISLLLILSPLLVSARIVPECKGPDGNPGPCGLCDFFLLIRNILNFIAFTLAPPVAALMFIAAGFLFLVSGGSEERVNQARKIFFNVVIGLFFIYASWLIIGSLINVIGRGIEGFSPETWYQFKCQLPAAP